MWKIKWIKKWNTDRVKRLVSSTNPWIWENTSKLAGTTLRLCLLSFRSQLCLVLPRCNPAAVTPISVLNKCCEVLTPPCLDSQAGSPDSRTALRRTYQHKPPYRNAAEAWSTQPAWPKVWVCIRWICFCLWHKTHSTDSKQCKFAVNGYTIWL